MKKNIYKCFSLLLLMVILLSGCSSNNSATTADGHINSAQVMFTSVQKQYNLDGDTLMVLLTVIDNSGNIKAQSFSLNSKDDRIQYLNDPNFILQLETSLPTEDWFQLSTVDITTLRKAYNNSLKIKNRLEFEYSLASATDIGGYAENNTFTSSMYGYYYDTSTDGDYVATKYYNSDTVISYLADSTAQEILEFLFINLE